MTKDEENWKYIITHVLTYEEYSKLEFELEFQDWEENHMYPSKTRKVSP